MLLYGGKDDEHRDGQDAEAAAAAATYADIRLARELAAATRALAALNTGHCHFYSYHQHSPFDFVFSRIASLNKQVFACFYSDCVIVDTLHTFNRSVTVCSLLFS